MKKQITKGHDARTRVKAGVDKAADAVAPTLGAVGMTALIEFPGLDPITADDGITILRNLEFADGHENMGLQIIRKAALRTSEQGGDGTATTTVVTRSLATAAFNEIGQESSKIREVSDRLDVGLADALVYLKSISQEISEADIERVAEISSLDPEVAKLIAEVIKEVGVNGVVTVEQGAKLGYEHEVVKGARFNKGLISPFFINDHENARTVLEDAWIVLVDRKISTNEQILGILKAVGTGTNILFIATDVDSVALGTLAKNAAQGIAHIACVQNPYQASPSRDFLFDMAALTGATVISEEMGMKLDEQGIEVLGKADKVIVTRDTTTIIGGQGDPSERIKEIEAKITETTSDYQRGMLEDRLAALSGGIGVIKVGTYTDTEFNAKRYKFENAINSTQAALQEGILPGGGIALLKAAHRLSDPMFKTALEDPFLQMCVNAGMVKGELDLEMQPFTGIDFRSKQKVDMFEAGIIDPYKVVRIALESAVAVSKQLINFETVITLAEEPTHEAL